MKLLKSNLYNLGESMGIQLPNIENFKFPGLPSDHRRNLVPKESTEEKQLMFKEGDKMRIPGVLDYTGAKYPFKKIKKGQKGLRTNKDNINRTPKYGIRINDHQSNDFFYNDFVPRLIQTRPDLTLEEISKVLEIPITVYPHYGYLFYSVDDDFKNQRLAAITGNPLNDDGSWITQTLMPFYRDIKIVLNPYRDDNVYSILPHEYNHAVRLFVIPDVSRYPDLYDENTPPTEVDFSGYTQKEAEMLHDAYNGLQGYDYYGTGEWVDDEGYEHIGISERDFPALVEKGASNTELRSILYKEFCTKYGKRPTINELNKFIDNYSDDELMKLFKDLNGYTNYMYDSNEVEISGGNAPLLDPKKIKQTLKYVAMEQVLPRQELLFGKNGTKLIRKGQKGLDTNIFYNYSPYYTGPGSELVEQDPVYVGYDGQGIPITFNPKEVLVSPGTIYTTSSNNGELIVSVPKISKENTNFFRQFLPNEEDRRKLYALLDPLTPAYKDRTPKNKNSGSRVLLGDNLNNRLDKLRILILACGNPIFDTTDTSRHYGFISGKRAHVDFNNKVYLRGNNYGEIDSIITELTHMFLKNNPYSKLLGIDSTLFGMIGGDIKDFKGRTGYNRPGHSEFNAHKVLEPAFRNFIFDKNYKSIDDLKKLIEKHYKAAYHLGNGGLLLAKSGIKIKKKNKGKFTQYCNGKVTQECINRAKHSGNKTLVKRAVFAQNARKWKH